MLCDRLVEQLKSARSQLDTLNDEKEHLQERHQIIVEQTRRDLAVKHAECQEYKAKVRQRNNNYKCKKINRQVNSSTNTPVENIEHILTG